MKRHRPAVCTEEGEKKMRNADCGTRNGGHGKEENAECGLRNAEHGKQKSKIENRRAPVPSILKSEAQSAFSAVIFDLLSALLNSWKLWNEIAGSDEIGLRWRKTYIRLTYAAGRYRPYEGIIGEAATAEGLPEDRAARLIQSWTKLGELKVEAARALFVAGSPADLPGATSVGMPVFWHNRLGLPLLDSSARPKFVSDSLWS
jgi:hypothetical protein